MASDFREGVLGIELGGVYGRPARIACDFIGCSQDYGGVEGFQVCIRAGTRFVDCKRCG